MRFRDRKDAGRRLAPKLTHVRASDPLVVGLPRGGVPVAAEVADALGAPLDVVLVRKIGVPFQPELAMGAIGEDGVRVVNDDVMHAAGVTEAEFAGIEARERAELERRAARFRSGRERIDVAGRTVIVVDDGIATGSTARAALRVLSAHGADHIVLAVPVAPPDAVNSMNAIADEVIALEVPARMMAVGAWYEDFSQTTDDEVVDLLRAARIRIPEGATDPADDPADPPVRDDEVEVGAGTAVLGGHLTIPETAGGIVLFAHGSGSSRHSPRNRFVADRLNRAGIATLLFDLLGYEEELDRDHVFDIDLLAQRLVAATKWLKEEPEAAGLPIGYFGASTGAAAALCAAADPSTDVRAVVSRGGRPDLAGPCLPDVRAPTLLIVGGHDFVVIDLNKHAARKLECEWDLEIVRGATHLFHEPGTLEAVADLAGAWFTRHLAGR